MSSWCFALINGKLAEIFFSKKRNTIYMTGHCYVKRGGYKTKREQKMIDSDIKKCQLTYKNKIFSDKTHPEVKFVIKKYK